MKEIQELEDRVRYFLVKDDSISKASVGWHIEHSLLTINQIIEQLIKSDPTKYKWSFSLPRIIVMNINKIPRGRAKSPDIVVPKNEITLEYLTAHILQTKARVKILKELDANKYFEHPYFGQLNLKPTIKFLGIHTRHHLLIIEDIIRHTHR